MELLHDYGIEIFKSIPMSSVSKKTIDDALDNFALIAKDQDRFNNDYDGAYKYATEIFKHINHVYIVDTSREEIDRLSIEYPEVAVLFIYDDVMRQWLYFDADDYVQL